MHTIPPRPRRCTPVLYGTLIGLSCLLAAQPAAAEDEVRAGAVLQVPFDLSSANSFFDPSTIRVGLTCQYAEVEEDEIITHLSISDHYTNTSEPIYVYSNLDGESTEVDEGDQVYGVEGNVFIELFNNLTTSVELLGFYGNNDIQGAFGAGYSFEDAFFLDAKVMFPYAEVGLRFVGPLEIYGGAKTLGSFNPAKEYRTVEHHTTVYDVTPLPSTLP
jgi:hypothetical protein